MMKCKICGSNHVEIAYKDTIRNGGVGNYTKEPVTIWHCRDCGVLWHDPVIDDTKQYYESKEYRNSVNGSSEAELFYQLYDKDTLEKFQFTGTDIFRQKAVADIGCGPGAFLDFLKGVAQTIIAVEPSETFRKVMNAKGYETYAYAGQAKKDWNNKIDVITSFDVIEHVEDPETFMRDIFDLLSESGTAVIGTPTDTPVMRRLLGEIYEKKVLFSTQHLWQFSADSLEILAKKAGFSKMRIQYFQRYGMGNLLGWLKEKEPCSDLKDDFITDTMDHVWKSECCANGLSDYIVLYVSK